MRQIATYHTTHEARSLHSGRQRFGARFCLAVIAVVLFTRHALSSRADDYGSRLTDFLNYRPHVTEPATAAKVLDWGASQGIAGLRSAAPHERESFRTAVHQRIADLYAADAVLPDQAPDVGVDVRVGEPRVVMYGPEGDVEDNVNNPDKIGFERFGHYMWPAICKLRDGKILIRVYVGGEDPRYPKPPEWLHFLSHDGGSHWQFIAVYDEIRQMASRANERPITEAAFRRRDGEELRYRSREIEIDFDRIALRGTRGADQYYRLGDLPQREQWFPLMTRRPGDDAWKEEQATWDPDALLRGEEHEVVVQGRQRKVLRLVPLGYPWSGDDNSLVELQDGTLLVTLDASSGIRPPSDLGVDGKLESTALNYVWRSVDGGRTWEFACAIPDVRRGPWFVGWRAHLEPRFANGVWCALYRTRGVYSGAGPMFKRVSRDQGRTWSEAQSLRPCSSGIMPGLMLENGIAVRAYGRPGAFLMFCSDQQGEVWGNDVTLIKPWPAQNEAKSCNNPHMTATGPDRFLLAYTRFDFPDPWGQPRLAVIAQEFVVTHRLRN